MREDFAVFILSHGRAKQVKTLKTLKRQNYSGKWYVVIDNEDDQEDEYRRRFGEHVLQFDKLALSKTFDTGDIEENRKTVVYARNACFSLARQVGVRYFLELDDDYTLFEFRKLNGKKLFMYPAKNLDWLFEAMVDFLNASGAKTVAFAQGGDFVGGGVTNPNFLKGILRKAMNTFFCDVEKPFTFVGRINEDVNTYVTLGMRGELMMTVTSALIVQMQTQKTRGGMTDVYIDDGTFLKSFYSVMYCPSAVKISVIGDKHYRIHHNVEWENCCPKILNERYRKVRANEETQ